MCFYFTLQEASKDCLMWLAMPWMGQGRRNSRFRTALLPPMCRCRKMVTLSVGGTSTCPAHLQADASVWTFLPKSMVFIFVVQESKRGLFFSVTGRACSSSGEWAKWGETPGSRGHHHHHHIGPVPENVGAFCRRYLSHVTTCPPHLQAEKNKQSTFFFLALFCEGARKNWSSVWIARPAAPVWMGESVCRQSSRAPSSGFLWWNISPKSKMKEPFFFFFFLLLFC